MGLAVALLANEGMHVLFAGSMALAISYLQCWRSRAGYKTWLDTPTLHSVENANLSTECALWGLTILDAPRWWKCPTPALQSDVPTGDCKKGELGHAFFSFRRGETWTMNTVPSHSDAQWLHFCMTLPWICECRNCFLLRDGTGGRPHYSRRVEER